MYSCGEAVILGMIEIKFVLVVIIIISIPQQKDLPLSNVFPHKKLFLMAAMDTISFSGLVISAAGVAPTMTVLLMHTNTPLMVLGSKYLFPDRKYSPVQLSGVVLISLALCITASRPILDLLGLQSREDGSSAHMKQHEYSSGLSTLVYIFSAGMQGLAALYKEKAIIEYCQPADIHVMSCWLFFYQILFALTAFPVLYAMQGTM